MKLLLALQVISALAPLVRAAVEAAEQVFGPMKGAEKLADATRRVEGALPGVAALAVNIDAARAAIGPMIEATVAAANKAGEFRTSRAKRARKRR